LSTRGYETMAETIFTEAVRDIISGHLGGATSSSNSARRRG